MTVQGSRTLRAARPPRVSPLRRLPGVVAWARSRWPTLLLMSVALVVIAIAWWHFDDLGLTLRYADGRAKLNMARRIFDSQTPGFGQIGGVWLPLPQLIMALLAWSMPLYTSGLAGSLWSMAAFAATCAMLFAIGRRLGGPVTGLCIVAIFAGNAHLLFLYATPMTEPLLISTIIAVTLALMRLEADPRRTALGVQLALIVLICTLTRYEGWAFLATVTLFFAFFLKRLGARWDETQARLVAFLALASQGVVFWLIWETVIFHNPLYFATSKYSAHEIDVVAYGYTNNINSLSNSVSTYLTAMRLNFADWTLALMALGLALLLAQFVRSRWRSQVAPLVLLTIPLFNIFSLFRGQSAIWIRDPAVLSDLHYNIRYGIVAAPLVAIFGGLAIGWAMRFIFRGRLQPLGFVAPVLLLGAMVIPNWTRLESGNLEFLLDRGATPAEDRQASARWLRDHYDGGRVLMEVFKNNDITFAAGIPQRRYITETNLTQFGDALRDPQDWVRWVYVGGRDDDAIRGRLAPNPEFHRYFERVHVQAARNEDDRAEIYRLRDQPLPCTPLLQDGQPLPCS